MIGEPAFALGNTIIIGKTPLEVERACSGLRIFMGVAAMAYVYIILVRRSWWEKCLLVVAIVPIALISNATRIAATAYLYQHISVEAGKKFIHDAAGKAEIVLAAGLFAFAPLSQVVGSRLQGARCRRFDPRRRCGSSTRHQHGPIAHRPRLRKLHLSSESIAR